MTVQETADKNCLRLDYPYTCNYRTTTGDSSSSKTSTEVPWILPRVRPHSSSVSTGSTGTSSTGRTSTSSFDEEKLVFYLPKGPSRSYATDTTPSASPSPEKQEPLQRNRRLDRTSSLVLPFGETPYQTFTTSEPSKKTSQGTVPITPPDSRTPIRQFSTPGGTMDPNQSGTPVSQNGEEAARRPQSLPPPSSMPPSPEIVSGVEPSSGEATTPSHSKKRRSRSMNSDSHDAFPDAIPAAPVPLPTANPQPAETSENSDEATQTTSQDSAAVADPLRTAPEEASHASSSSASNSNGQANGRTNGAVNGDGAPSGTAGTGGAIFARRRIDTGGSNPMAEHVEQAAIPSGSPAGPPITDKMSIRRANSPVLAILSNPFAAPPRSLEHYRRRLSQDSEEYLEKAKELQRKHREGRGS